MSILRWFVLVGVGQNGCFFVNDLTDEKGIPPTGIAASKVRHDTPLCKF